MAKESSRTRRFGELIHREIAMLIQQEIKDPRLVMLNITYVVVANDLSLAKVYFTTLNDDEVDAALEVLKHAAGFLRHEIARRILIRSMPQLRFYHDETLARSRRIDELLKQDKRDHAESSE